MSNIRIFITIGFLLLISSWPLLAQVIVRDVNDAFKILESKNASLKIAHQSVLDKRVDLKIQQGAMLPTWKVNATSDYYLNLPVQLIPAEIFGGMPGDFAEVRFGQPWVLGTGMEFQWSLLNPEKWREIKAAKLAIEQSKAQEQLEFEQLKIEVIRHYYALLYWKDYLPYILDLREQVNLLSEATEQKWSQELLSTLDRNRVEALRQQIFQQVEDARYQLLRSEQSLKSILYLEEEVDFEGSIRQLPIYIPINTSIDSRPAMLIAAWQLRYLEEKMSVKRGALMPTLSFISRYQFQWQTANLVDRNQYIGFDFGTVGLQFSWTLYQGNIRRRQIEKAQISFEQGRLRSDQIKNEIQHALTDWELRYREANTMVPITQKRLDLTEDNLKLALLRMEEGVSTIEEYFQVYQEYAVAAQSYFQIRLNLHIYHALLEL